MENGGVLSASVPIELDGRELQLRYRAYAFIRYAEVCGGDLMNDLTAMGTKIQPDENGKVNLSELWGIVRDIFWAGLVDAQPDLSRDEVSRMFGLADLMGSVVPAITQAIQKTMPAMEEKPRPIKARREMSGGGRASGHFIAQESASPPPNSSA